MADLSDFPDGTVRPDRPPLLEHVRARRAAGLAGGVPGASAGRVAAERIRQPGLYLFDYFALERGEFRVAHRIPYSDLADLTDEERARLAVEDEPLEFGHTLDDLIGGQIAAGFALTGFYEDISPGDGPGRPHPVLHRHEGVETGVLRRTRRTPRLP